MPAEYVHVVPLNHLMLRRRSEPHDVMAATQPASAGSSLVLTAQILVMVECSPSHFPLPYIAQLDISGLISPLRAQICCDGGVLAL